MGCKCKPTVGKGLWGMGGSHGETGICYGGFGGKIRFYLS